MDESLDRASQSIQYCNVSGAVASLSAARLVLAAEIVNICHQMYLQSLEPRNNLQTIAEPDEGSDLRCAAPDSHPASTVKPY